MDAALFVVSAVTLALVVWLLFRNTQGSDEPPVGEDVGSQLQTLGSGIELVELSAGLAGNPVPVGLTTGTTSIEIARVDPLQFQDALAPAEDLDWHASGLAASLGNLPMIVSMWQQAATLRVAFSPMATLKLATGQWKLVESAGRQLPTARGAGGQFSAHARVVGGSLQPQAFLALGGVTAIAAIAAYQQQKQLEAMLKAIDLKLRSVLDRLQDSDFGVLDATQELVDRISASLPNGQIPEQFAVELAVARRASDSVYFARRRWLRRTVGKIEAMQARAAEKSGQLESAWVKDLERVLGTSPEDFETEVAQFLQSLVLRAQLATLTALILASSGYPSQAAEIVDATDRELRESFYDLYRRMRGLAASELPGGIVAARRRKKQEPYMLVAQHLYSTMQVTVVPLLPPDGAATTEVFLRRSEDGTVQAMFPATEL